MWLQCFSCACIMTCFIVLFNRMALDKTTRAVLLRKRLRMFTACIFQLALPSLNHLHLKSIYAITKSRNGGVDNSYLRWMIVSNHEQTRMKHIYYVQITSLHSRIQFSFDLDIVNRRSNIMDVALFLAYAWRMMHDFDIARCL